MAVATATTAHRGESSQVSRRLVGRGDATEDRRLLIGGLVISGAIVAGILAGSAFVMTIASLAAFIAGVLYPPLGLVILAFMGPLRPPLAVPAPGFNILLVGAILLGCVYLLPVNRNRLFVGPPLLLLSAFVLYIFAQQLPEMASGYADTRAHDVGFLFFQLLTGLGTIVAAGFVMRDRSPYPFLAALLISATLAGVLGILTAGQGPHPYLENMMAPDDISARVAGPFGNPNAYGQFLAYGIVLAAAWITVTQSARIRAALLAAIAIMGFAVSLSLSRGAIVTLLAGLVVLAFARSRRIGFAAVGIAMAVVVIGYPLFVDFRLTSERGTVSSDIVAQLNESDEGRLDAVLAGPELFATSPIFGIGFGEYEYASALVADEGGGLVAHNWYGTVLAEQGLLGLTLWLLTLVTVAVWLRRRPATPRSVGFAVLGAAAVGCLFLQPPTSFQLSVVPIIAVTGALVGEWGGRVIGTGPDEETAAAGGHRPDPVRRPADAAGGSTGV